MHSSQEICLHAYNVNTNISGSFTYMCNFTNTYIQYTCTECIYDIYIRGFQISESEITFISNMWNTISRNFLPYTFGMCTYMYVYAQMDVLDHTMQTAAQMCTGYFVFAWSHIYNGYMCHCVHADKNISNTHAYLHYTLASTQLSFLSFIYTHAVLTA